MAEYLNFTDQVVKDNLYADREFKKLSQLTAQPKIEKLKGFAVAKKGPFEGASLRIKLKSFAVIPGQVIPFQSTRRRAICREWK